MIQRLDCRALHSALGKVACMAVDHAVALRGSPLGY
jgi:hypothetical protein